MSDRQLPLQDREEENPKNQGIVLWTKPIQIATKVTTKDNPELNTEEDRGKTFVATTATSADIIPETACYQRGREKNKDLGNLRMSSRGYSGR